MLEISEAVLQKLKCSQCENFLSSTPIILQTNGNSLCGDCVTPANDETCGTRNNVYEELAAFVLFPCRYKNDGCEEKHPFDKIKNHEKDCKHQKYECLVTALNNCEWTGKIDTFKQHFEEMHNELIVEHPYQFKPNISSESEKWLLFEQYKFLFLLQIKCNVAAAKLWFSVRFIGESKFASIFEYILKISDQNESFKKKRIVQNMNGLLMKRNKVLEIDINSLLNMIDEIDSVNCLVTVKIKNENCLSCQEIQTANKILLSTKGYYCSKCVMQIPCKYNERCSYKDIPMNVSKHVIWLCTYSDAMCPMRSCLVMENISLLDHINNFHLKSKKTTENCVEIVNKKINIEYLGCSELYNSLFYRIYSVFNSSLHFKIISNLSKEETLDFECTIKVFNPMSGFSVEKELKRDVNSLEYDWFVLIADDENNSFIRYITDDENINIFNKYVYSFSLHIRKID